MGLSFLHRLPPVTLSTHSQSTHPRLHTLWIWSKRTGDNSGINQFLEHMTSPGSEKFWNFSMSTPSTAAGCGRDLLTRQMTRGLQVQTLMLSLCCLLGAVRESSMSGNNPINWCRENFMPRTTSSLATVQTYYQITQ